MDTVTEKLVELSKTFFEWLWVSHNNITITQESDTIYRVQLQSDDSHILIWPHGKNLESITHIFALIFSKNVGKHCRVHVEVNDYLAKKDEKLLAFIQSKIDGVQKSGNKVILPFFWAYERKKIHSFVSEFNNSVYTKSEWEGNERRIHICKRDIPISIDIDGEDI